MKRPYTKQLLALVALAVPCMAAQAAQTITFPTGTLTTSNTIYQLTTGIGPGGFVAGQTSISGFGLVNTLTQNNTSQNLPNVVFCGSATPSCELSYAFSGFTYTGGYTNNGGATGSFGGTVGSRDYYFSGGGFGLYVDFTPDAVAPGANSTAAQFATAGQKFMDGATVLLASARASGTINGLTGGTPTTTTTLSPYPNTFAPATASLPTGVTCKTSESVTSNGSSVTLYSDCTQSTSTTTFSVTGATLKVTQDLAAGTFTSSILFDATGGQGFTNFNQNSQQNGTDLSAAISFASPTSCTFGTGQSVGSQQCVGSSTTSATVTPGTVVVVPEPHTLAVFGLGLLGLAGLRRRSGASAV